MAGVRGRLGVSEVTIEIADLSLVSHVENLGLYKIDFTNVQKCNLRFSRCRFAKPLAMLYFADQIRTLIIKNPQTQFIMLSQDNAFRGYASHIGLFQYIGFPRGNAPGQASGGGRYIPIEVIDLDAIRREAMGGAIGPIAKERAIRIARVLSQKDRGSMFDLFEYTFREIIRNSAEHSEGSKVVIMGQYWPNLDEAQIVIADNGKGIADKLYCSDMIECDTNLQALKFSLLPGVTSVRLDERIKQDERWGNSGFGLYLTSRVCSENGSFTIISGSDGVQLARGALSEKEWCYRGTLVAMDFKASLAEAMIKRLDQLVSEGEAANKTLLGNYPVSASAASKMLASHFEKISEQA